jgi:hypothetical protein
MVLLGEVALSSSIVAAATALRGALSGFDAAAFSGDDCARIAEELASTEKACTVAGRLAALRAADCKAHQARGYSDAADWLAAKAGTTPGQAKRNLKTAGKLQKHPDTRDAMLAGKVSIDQAAEIIDTAEQVAGSEKDLLDLAEEADLGRLKDRARDVRLGAIKPEDLRERQIKERYFWARRNQLGMVEFAGALPLETGVPFMTRLQQVTDRLKKAAKQAGGESEAWNAYAADAFTQMVCGQAQIGRWQAELTIVCDLRAWRRGHAHDGEPCHILDGGPIPVDLAEELGKDAFLSALVHDGVEINKYARFGRNIPTALRAALDLGDPPDFTGKKRDDCGKRHRLQLDHVDPVANGGLTSFENLKYRCYPHHQAKTARDRRAGLLGPNAPRPPNTS